MLQQRHAKKQSIIKCITLLITLLAISVSCDDLGPAEFGIQVVISNHEAGSTRLEANLGDDLTKKAAEFGSTFSLSAEDTMAVLHQLQTSAEQYRASLESHDVAETNNGMLSLEITLDATVVQARMSADQSPEQAARVFCRTHGLHENPRYDQFLQTVSAALRQLREDSKASTRMDSNYGNTAERFAPDESLAGGVVISVARDVEGRPIGRPANLRVLRRALAMGRLGLSRRAVTNVEVEVPVGTPDGGTRPVRVLLLEGETPLEAGRAFLARHGLAQAQAEAVAGELRKALGSIQGTVATSASVSVDVDGQTLVASMPSDMSADEAAVRFVIETGLSADPMAPRFTAMIAAQLSRRAAQLEALKVEVDAATARRQRLQQERASAAMAAEAAGGAIAGHDENGGGEEALPDVPVIPSVMPATVMAVPGVEPGLASDDGQGTKGDEVDGDGDGDGDDERLTHRLSQLAVEARRKDAEALAGMAGIDEALGMGKLDALQSDTPPERLSVALSVAGQQFEVDFAPGTTTEAVAEAFCEEQWELLEPLLASEMQGLGVDGSDDEDEDEDDLLRQADAAGTVDLPTQENCVKLLADLARPYVKQAEAELERRRSKSQGDEGAATTGSERSVSDQTATMPGT